MSGARLLTGKQFKANATSYTEDITRTVIYSQWTQVSEYACTHRVPIMGASPDTVCPLSFKLDGSVKSPYSHSDMRYEVKVYDNADSLVWQSATYIDWGKTVTTSQLDPVLYSDTDIAYRVEFRAYVRTGGYCDRTNFGDVTLTINCEYTGAEEETTAPPPFELPDDWVQNTTNTIADEFVPFETVTTPIDSDSVGESVDKFKEFLEGVQERETFATVLMGYVSELLRLKGITAFLCFAICCLTMIAIFELSGG